MVGDHSQSNHMESDMQEFLVHHNTMHRSEILDQLNIIWSVRLDNHSDTLWLFRHSSIARVNPCTRLRHIRCFYELISSSVTWWFNWIFTRQSVNAIHFWQFSRCLPLVYSFTFRIWFFASSLQTVQFVFLPKKEKHNPINPSTMSRKGWSVPFFLFFIPLGHITGRFKSVMHWKMEKIKCHIKWDLVWYKGDCVCVKWSAVQWNW